MHSHIYIYIFIAHATKILPRCVGVSLLDESRAPRNSEAQGAVPGERQAGAHGTAAGDHRGLQEPRPSSIRALRALKARCAGGDIENSDPKFLPKAP